jgi:hypothetical protein
LHPAANPVIACIPTVIVGSRKGARALLVRIPACGRLKQADPGTLVESTVLFLLVALAMLVAWLGSRRAALVLFALTFVASVALYLHHASDVLKLSF